MQLNQLGSTDIWVSQLGLGTVKFGRNQGVKYPVAFELPNDKAIIELLHCAQQCGINLLDTAPAYGSSEERIGKILKSTRHEWVLSTKVGEEFVDGVSVYDFSEKAIIHSVERSLQRLQTDYLDILLVHSNGEDEKIILTDKVFNSLFRLKQAGKIRAVGMSTKTVAGGLLALDHADVVMVTYNPIHQEEQPVIARAAQNKKGVLIKKAFASGHLQQIDVRNPIKKALQFIFAEPGVTSVILGTLNKEHLQQNAKAVINCVN